MFDDGSDAGPSLYAGGSFSAVGGVVAVHIARWDGQQWLPVGGGTNGPVLELEVFNDGDGESLFVGGSFDAAGGVAANNIAKWDGTSWSPLGEGVNSVVTSLIAFEDSDGPALFAGGGFTQAGGMTARFVARWDGTSWLPLADGPGMTPGIVEVACLLGVPGDSPRLLAGGFFAPPGPGPFYFLYLWDGFAWSAIDVSLETGGAACGGFILLEALALFPDPQGGSNQIVAGFTADYGVLQVDLEREQWSPVGELGYIGSSVFALEVATDTHGNSTLYAGGNFDSVGNLRTSDIAKWDGSIWLSLGEGLDSDHPCLGNCGGMSPAGCFCDSNCRLFNDCCVDADQDCGIGCGNHSQVRELLAVDDLGSTTLFVAGLFSVSGNQPLNNIAVWTECPPAANASDLNNDGVVDGRDLGQLLLAFGNCPGSPPLRGGSDCPADLNDDGMIDGADLGILLLHFG